MGEGMESKSLRFGWARRGWSAALVVVAACGCTPAASSGVLDGGASDAPTTDAADAHAAFDTGASDASASDASAVDAQILDAAGDASLPTSAWARYVIGVGEHGATLQKAASGNPEAGLVRGLAGRDYRFVFDTSAMYTLTDPVQPDDQFDWNKLPGLSDCNEFDLSKSGVMFGWRWRLDTDPPVLEITAYANASSMHQWLDAPLATLDADDLASETPLHYRLWADGALYRFELSGQVRGRAIDATATLPRQCPTLAPADLGIQWAAGLYFGGTSTAPSEVTGRIYEVPFQ